MLPLRSSRDPGPRASCGRAMVLGPLLVALGLAAPDAALAQDDVRFLGSLEEEFAEAFETEMAARGLGVQWGEMPLGERRLDRAAVAAETSEPAQAVAVWVEREGDERTLCATDHHAARLVVTTLPGGSALHPHTFAVLAGDLVDELRGTAAQVALPSPVVPTHRVGPQAATELSSPDTPAAASDATIEASADAPGRRPDPFGLVFDFGLAGSVMFGLELGVGFRVFGPLVLGVRVRSFILALTPQFLGSLSGGIFWVEPDDDIAFDGGIEGGATIETYGNADYGDPFDRTDPSSFTLDAAPGWMVGTYVGISFRGDDHIRYALRLGGAAVPSHFTTGPIPVLLGSFNATVMP